jgi:hypothetical protein
MMLCAILSDTLNLLGPTTTEWDKSMVALLAAIAEVDDIEKLAAQQFKAKSKQLANLSPNQLVCGAWTAPPAKPRTRCRRAAHAWTHTAGALLSLRRRRPKGVHY